MTPKNCSSCPSKQTATAPEYVSDIAFAFAERTSKRLWIVIIILIVALIATNLAWVIHLSQYNYVDYVVDATENSNAGFIGGNGRIENIVGPYTSESEETQVRQTESDRLP